MALDWRVEMGKSSLPRYHGKNEDVHVEICTSQDQKETYGLSVKIEGVTLSIHGIRDAHLSPMSVCKGIKEILTASIAELSEKVGEI